MKTILIGDIHACSREFSALLERIGPARSDQLILMGDLVNKGPDPAGVIRAVRSLNCLCLRGNHENDHLNGPAGLSKLKAESELTKNAMPLEEYAAYLALAAAMPLYFENSDLIAVHGALDPVLPLDQQPADLLTGDITPPPSWKDDINLGRPLVVGHKRYSREQAEPFIVEGRFYGIDTGCVYGGALTALELPSGELWQVRAARDYSTLK